MIKVMIATTGLLALAAPTAPAPRKAGSSPAAMAPAKAAVAAPTMAPAAPAPVPRSPAMQPCPAPSMGNPVGPTMAPASAPVTGPAMAPASAPVTGPIMQPCPSTAPAAPTPKKTGQDLTFWIGLIGSVIAGAVTTVLAYLNKQNKLEALKTDRAKMILAYIQLGVESFEKYAQTTAATWDDALAKILKDINSALIAIGQPSLTPIEIAQAKASANAQKSLILPDPPKKGKPADKPKKEQPEKS